MLILKFTAFNSRTNHSRDVVSNLKKSRKIELNIGYPKTGWIPVEFKSEDFELEFIASYIPEIPTDKLCESLILVIYGIDTEICWNLEPECYFFEFKQKETDIEFLIFNNDGQTASRNLIYKITGDFKSLILPIYRSLKKFNTLEYDESHWKKIDNIKLDKLTKLIKDRKTTYNNV